MGAPVPPRALSRHDGQSNFSALTVIAESPLDRNVLYTGADDGSLQMTRDGGQHWTSLTARVSGPAAHAEHQRDRRLAVRTGRVYLTVDGHFNDDYHPYVFVSEDYGEHWRSIASGLPQASVHRIREHPSNPDFLVVGHGGRGLRHVRPRRPLDLAGHEPAARPGLRRRVPGERGRAGGRHARPQHLGAGSRRAALANHLGGARQRRHLFPVPPTHDRTIYGGQFWFGAGEFFAPNPPFGALVTYYLSKRLRPGEHIHRGCRRQNHPHVSADPASAGMNRTCWDLRLDPPVGDASQAPGSCAGNISGLGFAARNPGAGPRVLPGRYTVSVTPAGTPTWQTEVRVLADPLFTISDADRQTRYATLQSAYLLQQKLAPAREAAAALATQSAGKPAAGTISQIQSQINAALAAAARVQSAIDSYDGLPTAAQLQELDWAWSDGAAAVTALNRLLSRTIAVPTRE